MVSREAEFIKDIYVGFGRQAQQRPDMSMAEVRQMYETLHLATAEPEGVEYAETKVGGVPAIVAKPVGVETNLVILYCHGGGHVGCSSHSHRKLVGHLARAFGAVGYVLDYRRAPESPFPAAIDDVVQGYRWLLDQGADATKVVAMGDSAGGGTCANAVLRISELGLPLPGAMILLSPWLDMEMVGDSMDRNAEVDKAIQREALVAVRAAYLGDGTSPADPRVNPLHADLSVLPPTYLQAGGEETLVDDSYRFAERAKAAGVDVSVDVEQGMQHDFQCMAGRAPEADQAIDRLAAWLHSRI